MMETITLLFIMTDEQDVFNLKSLVVSLEVGIGIDCDVVAFVILAKNKYHIGCSYSI